jgi:hypothetical protein
LSERDAAAECRMRWRTCCFAFALVLAPGSASASALSELASSLAPGEWAILSTEGFDSALWRPGHPADIFEYSANVYWDPHREGGAEQGYVWFYGQPHPGYGENGRVVRYLESDNRWEIVWEGSPGRGHTYDEWAFRPDDRTIWRVQAGPAQAQRFTGSEWVDEGTADGPYAGATTAWDWFPEREEFWLFTHYRDPVRVLSFSPETATWTMEASFPEGCMTYHPFAVYSPVQRYVVFGGGNGCTKMWRVDEEGTVTPSVDGPHAMGMTSATVTADPVTGDVLALFSNGEMRSYRPSEDTWSEEALPNPFAITGGDDDPSLVAGPIDTYGVVIFVDSRTSPGNVYLYRHAAGAAPIDVDAGTTAPGDDAGPSADGGEERSDASAVDRSDGGRALDAGTADDAASIRRDAGHRGGPLPGVCSCRVGAAAQGRSLSSIGLALLLLVCARAGVRRPLSRRAGCSCDPEPAVTIDARR